MLIVRVVATAIAGGGIAALLLAGPAAADPGMPPCSGLLAHFCNMVPTMPELDHDLDLTQNQPQGPAPEDAPPADVCSIACI